MFAEKESGTAAARWCAVALCMAFAMAAPAAGAQQGPPPPANGRRVVCADGVRKYAALKEVPLPFDSLMMPAGPPIRVTNEEEARAAQRRMLERAGSVGATGVVITDESQGGGDGEVNVRRRVLPVFVPADTARAYAACRKP